MRRGPTGSREEGRGGRRSDWLRRRVGRRRAAPGSVPMIRDCGVRAGREVAVLLEASGNLPSPKPEITN